MAYYTDNPPGYDYVIPPRVFAPIPHSSPRQVLGDERSLFAPGTPEWVNSRTNLAQTASPAYQEDGLRQEPAQGQGRWKKLSGKLMGKHQMQQGMQINTFVYQNLHWTAIESNWKPVSLRAPFLLAVIIVSIALVIALQLLLFQSQRDGGILFAKNVNSLPLSTTFPYLYLPTIIAVIYGFMWSWIDLDVRRIEPFLQLAKEEGATGRESLLLHYPVDFLASVPIKAMKSGYVDPISCTSI
jgi:Protein of unknown function (DUF3433)